MNDQTSTSSIPAAWLNPLPPDYRIPLWRWIILPATALMLKRTGGVWHNGTLTLTETGLRFEKSRLIKSASTPAQGWTIPLETISRIDHVKGMASETISLHHAHGTEKLLTARAGDFLARLRAATQEQ